MTGFDQLVKDIRHRAHTTDSVVILSERIDDGEPRSFAMHMTIDGDEGLLTWTPTDLRDAGEDTT